MSNVRHFHRTVGALAGLWDKIPELCQYQDCPDKPAYRNRMWHGRVVFTCARHTPGEYREHPIPEEGKRP